MRHRLAGLEFGVAIPASLGGAVKMNAGAHGRSMSDVLDRVELFLLGSAGRQAFGPGERSGVPVSDLGATRARVVGAAVSLQPGDDPSIRERMEEAREWRRRTQPIAEPNCGSVFKNPEGAHAAS